MDRDQIDQLVFARNSIPATSAQDVYDHFAEKYPLVDYQGRKVFLFTTERSFGSAKHIIHIHGASSPYTPENIYQYVTLKYCYAGTHPMRVDGEPILLRQGDFLIVERLSSTLIGETGPNDVTINIMLNERFFSQRFLTDAHRLRAQFGIDLATTKGTHRGYRLYHAQDDDIVDDCMQRILSEHFEARPGSADIIDDYVAVLLTHLIRSNEPDVASQQESQKHSQLAGLIREYVSLHYREGSLAQMARDLGFDSSYLSAQVRRLTGVTFKQLVNEERMRRATVLLLGSEKTVHEVAEEVGISNLTQFYRRFHDYAGCTPKEYRQSSA